MQLGMIGLGRMGGNMVTRLSRAGHDCLVYDTHQEAGGRAGQERGEGHDQPEGVCQPAEQAPPGLADGAGRRGGPGAGKR